MKAIVMLGARVLPPGEASPTLARRAEKAAELYRRGLAPLVVFSGGVGRGLPSEARVASELAIALGVPREACVLEEASHSTWDNAHLTAPLLAARGIDEVLLVSDGYHLLRAQKSFAAAGIRARVVSSGRPLTRAAHFYWTVREAVALLKHPSLL
jgi:uncharacterized SAM-binding protein YcdF (DUF218 family)